MAQQSEGRTPARVTTVTIVIVLVVVMLLSILFTPVMRPTTDGIATRLLPISILRDGDVYLEEYRGTEFIPDEWFLGESVHGRLVSNFPIGTSLLIAPLYIVPVVTGWIDEPQNLYTLARLSALLITALAAIVIFLTTRSWVRESTAALLAVAMFFGTSLWSVASQDLWQHGATTLMLALSLYIFSRLKNTDRTLFALLGFTLGWAVLSRYSSVIIVVPIIVLVCMQFRKNAMFMIPGGTLPAMIFLAYNGILFGWPYTGLSLYSDSGWGAPSLSSMLGVWLSPSKGLLWYSPFLIFGFVGFWRAVRWSRDMTERRIAGLGLIVCVLHTFLLGIWIGWHGGGSFGPRLMIELIPFLVLGVALGIRYAMLKKRWMLGLFVLTLGVSILTHGIGAATFDYQWYGNIGVREGNPWLLRDGQLWFYYERFFLAL